MSTQFNYQKHFYFKKFLIQPIQFRISLDFVYTQLNFKNSSILNNTV